MVPRDPWCPVLPYMSSFEEKKTRHRTEFATRLSLLSRYTTLQWRKPVWNVTVSGSIPPDSIRVTILMIPSLVRSCAP